MLDTADIPVFISAASFLFFTDQPLHSTAVDAYAEEHSENESSSHVPAPQRTNVERRSGGKINCQHLIFLFLD